MNGENKRNRRKNTRLNEQKEAEGWWGIHGNTRRSKARKVTSGTRCWSCVFPTEHMVTEYYRRSLAKHQDLRRHI